VKRNRRRAIVLAISAIAFVVLAAGWVRSHFVGDEFQRISPRPASEFEGWAIAHGGGDIALVHWLGKPSVRAPEWFYLRRPPLSIKNNFPDRVVGLGGYGWCRVRNGVLSRVFTEYDGIVLPYWLLMLIASAPWFLFAWRHWRNRAARRIAAGLCAVCGYDLRAGHDRCPECGATAPPRPEPSPA
jgi:hypothetical protein